MLCPNQPQPCNNCQHLPHLLPHLPHPQVAVGPLPPGLTAPGARPHGSGTLPLGLPHLLELAARCVAPGTIAPSAGALAEAPPLAQFLGSAGTAGGSVGAGAGAGGAIAAAGALGGMERAFSGPPPGALSELAAAVEAVFSSPGYLAAGFALPPPGSGSNSGSTSRGPPSPEVAYQDLATVALVSLGVPPHNLDVTAVSTVYSAILKAYSPEVLAALASGSTKLLEQLQALLSANHSQQAAGGPGGSGGGAVGQKRSAGGDAASGAVAFPTPPLQQQAVLPALFVLLQSPLNGEALGVVGASSTQGVSGSLMGRLVDVWLQLSPMMQQVRPWV